jgi:hypothetical protein
MLNSSIIEFYGGTHPDHRGRYLREIQQWQDSQLEAVHDYIQWLFPLPERSGFNVAAPVLNPKSIQEFRNQPDLKDNLRDSFVCMPLCIEIGKMAFSRESQSSADHENLEVLDRTWTRTRGKSVFRLFR